MKVHVVASVFCYSSRMMETLRVLLVLGSLLVAVEHSGCALLCSFQHSLGECDAEIGEVNQDDCCQNPHYGYKAPDGECQFCGPSVWSSWLSWSPCNNQCGDGVRQRTRKCFGESACEGVKTDPQMEPCTGTYCDDTFQGWSYWSSWGECSSSCIPHGQLPNRTRHRVCISSCNQSCQGEASQVEDCSQLPPCPVTGTWGPWSAYSSCPVTCGVGLQVSSRRCENSGSVHGDSSCPGEERRTKICHTNIHCPVNGVWSEWSEWSACKHPFSKDRDIRCKQSGGSQTRERMCLHRAYDGAFCSGDQMMERRVCYDVHNCHNLKGTWDGWGQWTFCKPTCGANSKRIRSLYCKPDYSDYSPTIGRQQEIATFFGTPKPDCGPVPGGGRPYESQACVNAPPCEHVDLDFDKCLMKFPRWFTLNLNCHMCGKSTGLM